MKEIMGLKRMGNMEIVEAAAEYGDTKAQIKLGDMYRVGRMVKKDSIEAFKWSNPQLAVEWYQKAAAQGHSRAQNNLGYQYHNGRGVPKDYGLAYFWYQTAAEQGHDCGQYNVGFMWHHGHGVSKNVKTAVEWYRKAADQGYLSAQKLLGHLYSKGNDILADYNLAVHYYLMASEKGEESARLFLEKSEHRNYINTYFSRHWPDFHSELIDDMKFSIRELYMILLLDGKLPRELWSLIVRGVIDVWPTSAHRVVRRYNN